MKVSEDVLPHAAAGGGRATGQDSRLRRGQFPTVLDAKRSCLKFRETREGWPLLTFETEANGDSRSQRCGTVAIFYGSDSGSSS